MKHVYAVEFEPLWYARLWAPWWGESETIRVIANGDAKPAIRRAERIMRKRVLDDKSVTYRVRNLKLISVRQENVVE